MPAALQPSVSIIVAVYNAEKTLHRCIDSLLVQTYKSLEIILIDDGSTDRSLSICKEYAGKDKRIKFFHQENRGVAYTRQKGLELATGTYIIHADPDDWVATESLSLMVKYAEEQNSDMLICDFWHNFDDKEVRLIQKPTNLTPESVIIDFFPRIHGSCWNKLVKRETILKYGIKFNDKLTFCEDLIFNINLLKHPIKVSYLDIAHYHYYYTDKGTSLASRYDSKTASNDLLLFEVMKDTLPANIIEQTLPQFAIMLLYRAYEGHSHRSCEFKRIFQPYFKYVKRKKLPMSDYLLMMMAKHGLYCVSYYISHSRLKHLYFGIFDKIKQLKQVIFKKQ